MKKFFLTGLALLFLSLNANAVTSVVHYNAGFPTSMTTYGRGYMSTTPIVRGNTVNNSGIYNAGIRNYATVRPVRPPMGIQPRGAIRPLPPMAYRTNRVLYNNYYNNYQPTVVTTTTTTETSKNSTSRFNKNYTKPQRSSYTRNGVTYYN